MAFYRALHAHLSKALGRNSYSSVGAALTELAILLLLLLVLVLTFTEMGITIRRANVVIEASRAGARAGGARSLSDWTCPTSLPPQPGSQTCGATPGFTDPIAESAYQAACNFIGSEGMPLSNWKVTVSYRALSEGGYDFPFLDLRIDQSDPLDPSQRNCIICLQGFMKNLSIDATSSFAIQRRCP